MALVRAAWRRAAAGPGHPGGPGLGLVEGELDGGRAGRRGQVLAGPGQLQGVPVATVGQRPQGQRLDRPGGQLGVPGLAGQPERGVAAGLGGLRSPASAGARRAAPTATRRRPAAAGAARASADVPAGGRRSRAGPVPPGSALRRGAGGGLAEPGHRPLDPGQGPRSQPGRPARRATSIASNTAGRDLASRPGPRPRQRARWRRRPAGPTPASARDQSIRRTPSASSTWSQRSTSSWEGWTAARSTALM